MKQLSVSARRYLTYAPTGEESIEANFRYQELDLEIESAETVLILVDCWDHHYIDTHLSRAKEIVSTRLGPFTDFCRRAGILVVHAPGLGVIGRYRDWMANPEDWDQDAPEPDWPPDDFRNRTGPYSELTLWKSTPPMDAWSDYSSNRMGIMRELGPEPGDVAVADGDQLHALLRDRRIMHLLYAGFATNWCVTDKNYGMRAMSTRGYNVVLLRDATTAIETHESYQDELMKENAILTAEMMTGFSSTCAGILESNAKRTEAPATVRA
ncbi:MAG: isochorismatase family protein [Gammaproteobacteria bacterium]|jgi:hypothetical protein|nr:isochorismatase family protein [Gammaproteobacteria bacterium]